MVLDIVVLVIKELLKVLPPRLLVLDFVLCVYVAAVGGQGICWPESGERAWDPPPRGLWPVLASARRLFFGWTKKSIFAESFTVYLRSGIEGWVAFPLGLIGLLVLGVAGELNPLVRVWAGPLFGGKPLFYGGAWLLAVAFTSAAFFLGTRAVVRGFLCLECVLAAGGRRGCSENKPCDEGADEAPDGQQRGEDFLNGRLRTRRVFLPAGQIPPEFRAVRTREDEVRRECECAQRSEEGEGEIPGIVEREVSCQEYGCSGCGGSGRRPADSGEHALGAAEFRTGRIAEPACKTDQGKRKNDEGVAKFDLGYTESHDLRRPAVAGICDGMCEFMKQGLKRTEEADQRGKPQNADRFRGKPGVDLEESLYTWKRFHLSSLLLPVAVCLVAPCALAAGFEAAVSRWMKRRPYVVLPATLALLALWSAETFLWVVLAAGVVHAVLTV